MALGVAGAALLGAAWGWLAAGAPSPVPRTADGGRGGQEADVFAMPPRPTEPLAGWEEQPVDPRVMRAWEVTARQPLPPRKEPLTPPRWRIVGVTMAGKDKNVLLLFEGQTTAEAKKVGDALPGGAKIVQITQDELRISLNGQFMKLNLRKQ